MVLTCSDGFLLNTMSIALSLGLVASGSTCRHVCKCADVRGSSSAVLRVLCRIVMDCRLGMDCMVAVTWHEGYNWPDV